jgi:hypothetical protein
VEAVLGIHQHRRASPIGHNIASVCNQTHPRTVPVVLAIALTSNNVTSLTSFRTKITKIHKNMSPLLVLISYIRNSLIHCFVNVFIHNSRRSDNCSEAIHGQAPFIRGVGITFFHRKRSFISTFMAISR